MTRIWQICQSYESGLGHGLQQDGLDLSKTPHSDPEMGEAYQCGYEAGMEIKAELKTDINVWRFPERDNEAPKEGAEVIYIVKYDATRKKQIGVYKWGKVDEGYTIKDLLCWIYAPKDPMMY